MKEFNTIITEASNRLSKDFEVGANVLSNQTKGWLKELDAAVDKHKLNYDQCRKAAKQFKQGNFEEALRTIWGKQLDVEVTNSENGGNSKTKIYRAGSYAVFTEKTDYKNSSFVKSITGSYSTCSAPGYSLGTIITVSGKAEGDVEIAADHASDKAMAARNTANIYNILFVGVDVPSKFISKPMLKLKKPL